MVKASEKMRQSLKDAVERAREFARRKKLGASPVFASDILERDEEEEAEALPVWTEEGK